MKVNNINIQKNIKQQSFKGISIITKSRGFDNMLSVSVCAVERTEDSLVQLVRRGANMTPDVIDLAHSGKAQVLVDLVRSLQENTEKQTNFKEIRAILCSLLEDIMPKIKKAGVNKSFRDKILPTVKKGKPTFISDVNPFIAQRNLGRLVETDNNYKILTFDNPQTTGSKVIKLLFAYI